MAATLTTVAINTRKTVRYGLYAVIAYFVIRLLLNLGIQLYRAINPAGPPPPTVGFKVLPAIDFPQAVEEIPTITYTIETATGGLPTAPTQMRVYLMPKYSSTLASVDNARIKARALGFENGPTALTSTLYRFSHPEAPATMEINIVTGNFSTSFNLAADPSPLESNPPAPEEATRIATSLLRSANSLPEDLSGPITHDYLKIEGQNLVSALSQSDANLVRVNIFRKPMEKTEQFEGYPSLASNPKEANTWLILSGASQDARKLIALEHHYYPIDESIVETYPIRTPEQAVADLQAGKGYVANLGLNREGNVTIRDIYLAYFDPPTPSQFYQPVYVFEGDRDFFAYLPAVTTEYYGEATSADAPAETPAE